MKHDAESSQTSEHTEHAGECAHAKVLMHCLLKESAVTTVGVHNEIELFVCV